MQAGGDATFVAGNLIQNIGAAPKQFSPLHQLPAPPAVFTGRDEELDDLLNQLASAATHGAAISGKHAGLQGMGGVGKTALATVLAHRLADHYPDAQIVLNLRGAELDHRAPMTAIEAMQQIIHCFHPEARLPDTLDALTPCYLSVLTDAGRVLLLLDNAADENQIKPLLPPPNCLLLVTSRQHIQLPGLTARDLDCLKPEKSQELLLELAPRIQGHEADAAELCGHLPLKLEVFGLAVRKNTTYPVAELLRLLRERKHGLAPEDAALQVSYELLAEDLRRQWALLAVFPASFDLPAAAAVWSEGRAGSPLPAAGEAQERRARSDAPYHAAMQALVNASLVEFNESNGRFRLHDLVRQFCNDKLSEAEREAAHLRHAAHYRDVAWQVQALYQEKDKTLSGLELFDRERAHIEAAFEFLAGALPKGRSAAVVADPAAARGSESGAAVGASHTAALLISLVNEVVYTGSLRFHPRLQRIPWLEAQHAAARVTKNRAAEGAALGNLGVAYADLGEPSKAIGFCEQQLKIVREIGDRRGEGTAFGNLGRAYADLGEPRKAIEFCEQRLVIAREIGDRRGEGTALGNLGLAYTALGEPRKAIEFHEQYRDIAREIGDRRGEGNALGNLGVAYKNLGEPRKAIEFYEQHWDIAREIGDRRGEGNALGNLGNVHAALGESRKAIEFYGRHRDIAREIGDRRGEGAALFNSALALDQLSDRPKAITRARAALQIFEAIEDPSAAKVRATLAKWRTQG